MGIGQKTVKGEATSGKTSAAKMSADVNSIYETMKLRNYKTIKL